MKPVRHTIIRILLAIVGGWTCGSIWYLGWMYSGWPWYRVLRHFVAADGEHAYELVMYEQWAAFIFLWLMVLLLLSRVRTWSRA